jgi:hypothetical protein
MKKLKLFWSCIFIGVVVHAQVDGPFSGNSFTVVPIPGSSNTWVNAGNAGNSDNSYATFGNLPSPVGSYTDYLVITNFLFAVPAGVIITGIVVDIERSDPNRRTSDYSIRILKNGVIGAAERSSGAGYRAADNAQSYGSAGDLWGETWTDADINNAGFGVAIAAQRNFALGVTAGRIDDVQITVFYNFVVSPVNLISFSTVKKDKDVEIKWTTAEEVHMDHYEIERSANGRDFTSIGTVKSQQQLSQLDYLYFDNTPLTGQSYYRLKMVGTAGDIKYSKIISMQFNGQFKIALYPNPLQAGQGLNLVNPGNERLTITFYNISGKQIANVTTANNIIPVKNFQNQRGIMFYKIFQKNGNIAGTGKLLVQ